jgi:lipoate-protein ligase B
VTPLRPFDKDRVAANGWVIDVGVREFADTHNWQKSLVSLRKRGLIRDLLVIVEHPPVITLGRQTQTENLEQVDQTLPQFEVERGGDVTYHGPGQMVCYQIFDLNTRGRDIHSHIRGLEQVAINVLESYGVTGKRVEGFTGVWVETENGDRKIASVGVAAKQWVSYHGIAINLETDLGAFKTIKPCGLRPEQMTSLADLTGKPVDRAGFGELLVQAFCGVFKTDFEPVALEEIAESIESQQGSGNV